MNLQKNSKFTGVVALCGLLSVMVLGACVQSYTGDVGMTAWFNSWNTGPIGAAATTIYAVCEPRYAPLIALGISLTVALIRRDWWLGIAYGVSVALIWFPVWLIKIVFHRPRPAAALLVHPSHFQPHDWAFPSGHTAFIAALLVVGFLIVCSERGKIAMAVLIPMGITVIVAVVLIVGVHHITDTIGSVIWVLCAAPFIVAIVFQTAEAAHKSLVSSL